MNLTQFPKLAHRMQCFLIFVTAIMRSFVILQADVTQYLGELLPKLTEKLALAAKNPNKPHFNHYLFETITLAIK